jgi:hypothetical protein
LGLPCPCSYHHIPYALRVFLYLYAINPFDITTWHAFLFFLSWCLYFLSRGGEKSHQKTHTHFYQYITRNWKHCMKNTWLKTRF